MSDDAVETLALVRRTVQELVGSSPTFQQLPPGKQREMADDLVRVSTYLVAPEGTPANTLTGAVAVVANGLIGAIDFPNFAAGLITGVFQAIVDASIQQMEAYGQLLNDVAKTVDSFAHDCVSDDHARRFLVSIYPEYFEADANGHLRVRIGIDTRQAVMRLSRLAVDGRLARLDQGEVERKLVPAACRRLAANRQQLLSAMVLMGINHDDVGPDRPSR
jgi:hypothetical protein